MSKFYPCVLHLIIVAVLVTGCGKSNKTEVPEEGYNPEAKLEELKITLPSPPQPVANYVNGVRTGNLIFLAGKGPKRADGTEMSGKLGVDITIQQGYEGARLTAINQLAVLKQCWEI